MSGTPFHQCDACDGIVGLWEEVVGVRLGRDRFMHARCARPEDNAIPIRDWLDQKVAEDKAAR